MDAAQVTNTGFLDDTSQSGFESLPSLAAGLMHPGEVAADPRLTPAQKRAVLASWASDVRAVPNAPALRQLDNGAVVRIDDVLQALRSLDEPVVPLRPFARLCSRVPARLQFALRRGWPDDDDDDPPPCPVMAAGPFRGPLSGGETVDPGLVLAA